MIPVTIGFGGNLGRPDLAFQNALRDLDATPGLSLTAVSRLWRSEPWGVTNQPAFVNAVARFGTYLEPAALL
ncbi:MAG: 2-amino-4-hydroxy-6-hydroxymethyldihydropteridine diphosphokinase, partial [Gemmatimonadetes bacterium]|nr:2-amino-4-hydroxy-6-hydroxymethyldihydropteridine diphosphokinase [Gemmatimonadota bacterium]